jgi:hypothetical protein
VRMSNGIEESGGMFFSQRKNGVGHPPNATPAQSRTAPMAMSAAGSRLLIEESWSNPASVSSRPRCRSRWTPLTFGEWRFGPRYNR